MTGIVTDESFEPVVLNSKVPVLVDFNLTRRRM